MNNRGRKKFNKPKKDVFTVKGVITEILPKAQFKVHLEESGNDIIAVPSGKIRVYSIRLYRGDTVSIEISPYDLTKGRIVFRYNKWNKN